MDYDIQSVLREWAKMKDLKFTAESEPYRAAWSVLRGCLVEAADEIERLTEIIENAQCHDVQRGSLEFGCRHDNPCPACLDRSRLNNIMENHETK